jgi:hypothetical protein
MTTDMTQNKRLTWNRAGGLTLAVLIVSVLVGVWMMGQIGERVNTTEAVTDDCAHAAQERASRCHLRRLQRRRRYHRQGT